MTEVPDKGCRSLFDAKVQSESRFIDRVQAIVKMRCDFESVLR